MGVIAVQGTAPLKAPCDAVSRIHPLEVLVLELEGGAFSGTPLGGQMGLEPDAHLHIHEQQDRETMVMVAVESLGESDEPAFLAEREAGEWEGGEFILVGVNLRGEGIGQADGPLGKGVWHMLCLNPHKLARIMIL
jgi:hypothetical protein